MFQGPWWAERRAGEAWDAKQGSRHVGGTALAAPGLLSRTAAVESRMPGASIYPLVRTQPFDRRHLGRRPSNQPADSCMQASCSSNGLGLLLHRGRGAGHRRGHGVRRGIRCGLGRRVGCGRRRLGGPQRQPIQRRLRLGSSEQIVKRQHLVLLRCIWRRGGKAGPGGGTASRVWMVDRRGCSVQPSPAGGHAPCAPP